MKAYIFDMDGTLIDSTGMWAQIDVDFLAKRGLDVPPDYPVEISSRSFQEGALYTIERFGLSETPEELQQEWREMAEYAYGNTIEMKPHAREYLMALRERGAKLGIATSMMSGLYELVLKRHGIYDLFDAVSCVDEVGHGKSRPDIYHLAAKKLGTAPSDCIVFEDILTAIITAKSAGMTVCGVYDEASRGDWDEIKRIADSAIYDFSEAPLP